MMEPSNIDHVHLDSTKTQSPSKLAASCRLCFEADDISSQQALIVPCKCKGTIQFIHRHCLVQLRLSHPARYNKCPTCNAYYSGRWIACLYAIFTGSLVWRLATTLLGTVILMLLCEHASCGVASQHSLFSNTKPALNCCDVDLNLKNSGSGFQILLCLFLSNPNLHWIARLVAYVFVGVQLGGLAAGLLILIMLAIWPIHKQINIQPIPYDVIFSITIVFSLQLFIGLLTPVLLRFLSYIPESSFVSIVSEKSIREQIGSPLALALHGSAHAGKSALMIAILSVLKIASGIGSHIGKELFNKILSSFTRLDIKGARMCRI